jgi:hypothetical protein
LSERGLLWAVGMSRRQNVYPAGTRLTFPEARTGRRRKYHVPDHTAVSAETMLPKKNGRKSAGDAGPKAS